jgi:3-dehydroquinate synthase
MKTVQVSLLARTYPIYIGDNALNVLNTLDVLKKASTLVVVTNHTVQGLYLERVMEQLQRLNKPSIAVVLPDGESYKNITQLDVIYTAMLQARCDRKSIIIALGGGVIGDISGYAAATYMRGIPFIQVPTTLLAQVDSSVGGKTAINHPLGKNMIGAFYQPQAVLADSSVLATLPSREISAGLAEIIKYGCMADTAFFDWLVANIESLKQLDADGIAYAVQRSCELKAHVVSQDETESSDVNIRALLNFGHTFGHAFESVLGYGTWLHGEAVGYGMVCAAFLSHELGLLSLPDVQRIVTLVDKAGLPVIWPKQASDIAIVSAMKIDKKTEHGVLKFIVLDRIGQAHVQGVDESVILKVIAKLQA